jgi:hypothetical protein
MAYPTEFETEQMVYYIYQLLIHNPAIEDFVSRAADPEPESREEQEIELLVDEAMANLKAERFAMNASAITASLLGEVIKRVLLTGLWHDEEIARIKRLGNDVLNPPKPPKQK